MYSRLPRAGAGIEDHAGNAEVLHLIHVQVDGTAPVPDIEAHRRLQVPDHIYGVRFALTELWDDEAEANGAVHVDLYGRYLEPA